jgi:hypothetical protein
MKLARANKMRGLDFAFNPFYVGFLKTKNPEKSTPDFLLIYSFYAF